MTRWKFSSSSFLLFAALLNILIASSNSTSLISIPAWPPIHQLQTRGPEFNVVTSDQGVPTLESGEEPAKDPQILEEAPHPVDTPDPIDVPNSTDEADNHPENERSAAEDEDLGHGSKEDPIKQSQVPKSPKPSKTVKPPKSSKKPKSAKNSESDEKPKPSKKPKPRKTSKAAKQPKTLKKPNSSKATESTKTPKPSKKPKPPKTSESGEQTKPSKKAKSSKTSESAKTTKPSKKPKPPKTSESEERPKRSKKPNSSKTSESAKNTKPSKKPKPPKTSESEERPKRSKKPKSSKTSESAKTTKPSKKPKPPKTSESEGRPKRSKKPKSSKTSESAKTTKSSKKPKPPKTSESGERPKRSKKPKSTKTSESAKTTKPSKKPKPPKTSESEERPKRSKKPKSSKTSEPAKTTKPSKKPKPSKTQKAAKQPKSSKKSKSPKASEEEAKQPNTSKKPRPSKTSESAKNPKPSKKPKPPEASESDEQPKPSKKPKPPKTFGSATQEEPSQAPKSPKTSEATKKAKSSGKPSGQDSDDDTDFLPEPSALPGGNLPPSASKPSHSPVFTPSASADLQQSQEKTCFHFGDKPVTGFTNSAPTGLGKDVQVYTDAFAIVNGSSDSEVYNTHIFGHQFTLTLDVGSTNTRTVELGFAEIYGPLCKEGLRVFTVQADTESRTVDVFTEVGCNAAFTLQLQNISPDTSGKIDIAFKAITNFAMVSSVCVIDDEGSGSSTSPALVSISGADGSEESLTQEDEENAEDDISVSQAPLPSEASVEEQSLEPEVEEDPSATKEPPQGSPFPKENGVIVVPPTDEETSAQGNPSGSPFPKENGVIEASITISPAATESPSSLAGTGTEESTNNGDNGDPGSAANDEDPQPSEEILPADSSQTTVGEDSNDALPSAAGPDTDNASSVATPSVIPGSIESPVPSSEDGSTVTAIIPTRTPTPTVFPSPSISGGNGTLINKQGDVTTESPSPSPAVPTILIEAPSPSSDLTIQAPSPSSSADSVTVVGTGPGISESSTPTPTIISAAAFSPVPSAIPPPPSPSSSGESGEEPPSSPPPVETISQNQIIVIPSPSAVAIPTQTPTPVTVSLSPPPSQVADPGGIPPGIGAPEGDVTGSAAPNATSPTPSGSTIPDVVPNPSVIPGSSPLPTPSPSRATSSVGSDSVFVDSPSSAPSPDPTSVSAGAPDEGPVEVPDNSTEIIQVTGDIGSEGSEAGKQPSILVGEYKDVIATTPAGSGFAIGMGIFGGFLVVLLLVCLFFAIFRGGGAAYSYSSGYSTHRPDYDPSQGRYTDDLGLGPTGYGNEPSSYGQNTQDRYEAGPVTFESRPEGQSEAFGFEMPSEGLGAPQDARGRNEEPDTIGAYSSLNLQQASGYDAPLPETTEYRASRETDVAQTALHSEFRGVGASRTEGTTTNDSYGSNPGEYTFTGTFTMPNTGYSQSQREREHEDYRDPGPAETDPHFRGSTTMQDSFNDHHSVARPTMISESSGKQERVPNNFTNTQIMPDSTPPSEAGTDVAPSSHEGALVDDVRSSLLDSEQASSSYMFSMGSNPVAAQSPYERHVNVNVADSDSGNVMERHFRPSALGAQAHLTQTSRQNTPQVANQKNVDTELPAPLFDDNHDELMTGATNSAQAHTVHQSVLSSSGSNDEPWPWWWSGENIRQHQRAHINSDKTDGKENSSMPSNSATKAGKHPDSGKQEDTKLGAHVNAGTPITAKSAETQTNQLFVPDSSWRRQYSSTSEEVDDEITSNPYFEELRRRREPYVRSVANRLSTRRFAVENNDGSAQESSSWITQDRVVV